MTALEISRNNYNRFEDKSDITDLITALFCVESKYTKRDNEGYKIEGEFKDGTFEAVSNEMRSRFVSIKFISQEIRELCVEIMKTMKY